MKRYLMVILLLAGMTCQAQTRLWLQKVSDTTKMRPLKLNKNYKVSLDHDNSKQLKLISFTDTSLIFSTKGKTKEIIHVPLKGPVYLDTSPFIVRQLADVGTVLMILTQFPLIASPFIGLFDSWENAGNAVKAAGMLVGGGLLLVFPTLLFKGYSISRKWKIVLVHNQ